jgi:DNA-binding transcriptional MerR regulator
VIPSLNIAALTHRTGVPSDTIRKWEQRYGVLHPERTPGGQRRYSELDVARVEWLKERIHEGYRIGEAAALLCPGDQVARTVEELRNGIVTATIASDVDALGQLVEQLAPLPGLVAEQDGSPHRGGPRAAFAAEQAGQRLADLGGAERLL